MTQNATDSPSITATQRKAVAALLSEPTVTDAATAAGVNRTTIYRWLNNPAFRAALSEAEAEAMATFSRGLVRLAESALTAFQAALAEDEQIGVRLRAAQSVTGALLRVRELVELEARLAELEAFFDEAER